MSLISILTGKKVTIYSHLGDTEKQDVGVLEAVEGDWIRLRKADGETMFFAIYSVRMIKPFEQL
jgi:hypothetical protein